MFILKILVTYVLTATGAPGAFTGFKMTTYPDLAACQAVEHEEQEKVRAIFERHGHTVQTIVTTCASKEVFGEPV